MMKNIASEKQNPIFISYARADGGDFAKRLHDSLEENEIEVWLDVDNICDGCDWNLEIDKGLRSAKAVVVVMTPGSALSLQVTSEWNYAINRYIPVLPLLVIDCHIPRLLNLLNYIDFRENYSSGFATLISKLKVLFDDHLEYLQDLLQGFIDAQTSATEPQRFSEKIQLLYDAIDNWMVDREQDQDTKRANEARIVKEIDDLKENDSSSFSTRSRIVGQRLVDMSFHFHDRIGQRNEIAEKLSEDGTRLISIIGRGGIGKTALASKILLDLEQHGVDGFPDYVRGIVYMSTRTNDITIERIFQNCLDLLDDEKRESLVQLWKNSDISLHERISRLLELLRDGLYIFLFDNFEDLLSDTGNIEDEGIETFIDILLRTPNTARLIITTREPINFSGEELKHDKRIMVEDGLPEAEAIEMLRSFDPNSSLGIADADEELLRQAVRTVRGVPRAIEIVADILANDPFLSLEEMINNNEIFDHEEFVERLARENFRRYDETSRKVMEALAVFAKPVPIVAIEFVLEPLGLASEVKPVIERLIKRHTVKWDRRSKLLSLHPIDRDFIYAQIP